MATDVYANGLEVSAKKSGNKSIAAMPDVCLSPPSPPAGPIPIPYPNFSNAGDTTGGTRTVKLKGQEAGIKNESSYKSSKGDTSATRSFGMGVVTHTLEGKGKFAKWSMDVKFEGSNVQRFTDLTTHNHVNTPNSADTTASVGGTQPPPPTEDDCKELNADNAGARDELSQATRDKTLVGTDGKGRGTTVASAKFKQPSGAQKISAHSRGKAAEKLKSRFDPGGDPNARAAGASNLCAGSGHSHARPTMQKSGHAEARIFDSMKSPKAGAVVTLSIDWQRKSKRTSSRMPCEFCHRILCAAAEKCDMKIFLCDKHGKPQPLMQCPASPDSYEELENVMGE